MPGPRLVGLAQAQAAQQQWLPLSGCIAAHSPRNAALAPRPAHTPAGFFCDNCSTSLWPSRLLPCSALTAACRVARVVGPQFIEAERQLAWCGLLRMGQARCRKQAAATANPSAHSPLPPPHSTTPTQAVKQSNWSHSQQRCSHLCHRLAGTLDKAKARGQLLAIGPLLLGNLDRTHRAAWREEGGVATTSVGRRNWARTAGPGT